MSNLKPGKAEKRDYIRMNIETEVKCKVKGTGESFTGKCINLSHTGLQFSTSKNIKEGIELEITLKGPADVSQPPLQGNLKINRVIKNPDNGYTVSGELKDVR